MSASTQNQAKSAILFLYKEVLGEALPWLEGIESAKRPARLQVVLTRQEVESIPGMRTPALVMCRSLRTLGDRCRRFARTHFDKAVMLFSVLFLISLAPPSGSGVAKDSMANMARVPYEEQPRALVAVSTCTDVAYVSMVHRFVQCD